MQTAAFSLMSCGNLLGALVVARSRVLALLLSGMCVVSPIFLSRDWPIFRTVCAFGFAAGFLRVVQLARSTAGTTLGSRVLSTVFLVIDPRRGVARLPKTLRLGSFAAGIVEMGVAVALFLWLDRLSGAARVLVGGTSAYFIVEGVARFVEGLVAAFGVDAGPFHDAPIRARTVGEFWSRRWNRAIHVWLNEHAFRPTAKRVGVALGVLAAFGASALLHAIPIWVAFDLRAGLVMGAFFLIHGVIVIIESRLGVARWPRFAGHAWTLGLFAVTAPLFVQPMLASLGR